jgi:hypothetical protein
MAENKHNIVDADLEVLDLDELEAALGGAPSPTEAHEFLRPKSVATVPSSITQPFVGGAVLMENDGWQGNIYNVGQVLIENDGWQ